MCRAPVSREAITLGHDAIRPRAVALQPCLALVAQEVKPASPAYTFRRVMPIAWSWYHSVAAS
ncbi:MAG TPA: hypothetical protein VEI74_00565 [Candidatus Methylomirabilis sp.]|nr:hypothetical protein [Candidatus Methylomirabilis sp.]